MDIQTMIDNAKARENDVFDKFRQYDADGSGAIDEVRAPRGGKLKKNANCPKKNEKKNAFPKKK